MAGTTKRAAAASEQRRSARQKRSRTAQHSPRPEATPESAVKSKAPDLPLIVSTVLPDESELTERARELRSGLLRRAQVDWTRVPTGEVTLEIALANLPKEKLNIRVTGDPVAMADTVEDCLG